MAKTPIILHARTFISEIELELEEGQVESPVEGWLSHSHSLTSNIPDERAGYSQSLTDFVQVKQPQVTVTGIVTGNEDVNDFNKAWKKIYDIHRKATPVTVTTEWFTYSNMLLAKADAKPAGSPSRAMMVTLSFKKFVRAPKPPPPPKRRGVGLTRTSRNLRDYLIYQRSLNAWKNRANLAAITSLGFTDDSVEAISELNAPTVVDVSGINDWRALDNRGDTGFGRRATVETEDLQGGTGFYTTVQPASVRRRVTDLQPIGTVTVSGPGNPGGNATDDLVSALGDKPPTAFSIGFGDEPDEPEQLSEPDTLSPARQKEWALNEVVNNRAAAKAAERDAAAEVEDRADDHLQRAFGAKTQNVNK